MERNKTAQREGGGRDLTVVLKESEIYRNVFCLAKHEIMNVILSFSVHVTAYMIG